MAARGRLSRCSRCTEGLELAADAPAAVVAIPNLLVAVYVAEALGDEAVAARPG